MPHRHHRRALVAAAVLVVPVLTGGCEGAGGRAATARDCATIVKAVSSVHLDPGTDADTVGADLDRVRGTVTRIDPGRVRSAAETLVARGRRFQAATRNGDAAQATAVLAEMRQSVGEIAEACDAPVSRFLRDAGR